MKSKKKSTPELSGVYIKMNDADRKRLLRNAKRWAKGNLSAWIRHAARKYKPEDGETVS